MVQWRWAVACVAAAAEELRSSCRAGQILELAQEPQVWPGAVDGLECHSSVTERCCPEKPVQQVLAWIQLASDHNHQQLESLEVAVSNAVDMRHVMHFPKNGVKQSLLTDSECKEPHEAILVTRAAALKAMVEDAKQLLTMMVHLLISGLCRFCYDLDDEALKQLQDGQAAQRVAATLQKFQRLQVEIHKGDLSVAAIDTERRCIPYYLVELLPGVAVGDFSSSAQAVKRLVEWPLQRRLDPQLAAEGVREDRLHEDFFEVGDRLFSSILAAPGRVGHQLNLLCLSMERRNHWSRESPTARILWGLENRLKGFGEDAPNRAASKPGAKKAVSRQANQSYGEPDPGAAFGLVVLISNQTRGSTVAELLKRLEGPQCLFLEDTCGSALEALGYNCHSNNEEQRSCLYPGHASLIIQTAELERQEPALVPHVAWRRHAGTRHVLHSILELGSSLWGPESSIWIMDFRPEAKCIGQKPLAEQLKDEPQKRLKLVKKPDVLLGMPPETVEPLEPSKDEAPVRFPTETPWAIRLAEYQAMHQQSLERMKSMKESEFLESGIQILVYSCEPYAQCGGHGDRLNGIITVFLLAVLTNRIFLIDSESPLPLQLLLEPRGIDWRVAGGIRAKAGLRHLSYHDKRRNFEADLERLATYPEQILVINMNYRMIRSLFEAVALREAVHRFGLPEKAPPFLAAEIFDALFAPTQLLRQELHVLRQELDVPRGTNFIAIHLRTGQIAYDPSRHGADELEVFLACARRAEKDVGEALWLLATDSENLAQQALELPEAKSGKLRLPHARGRVHIDRSDLGETLNGATANYAEWLLFGQAAAVILSRSYFGETAAEIGRVRHAYFAPGNGCVRTDLSSS